MKKILPLLFVTLIFHYSLIIPQMKWNCICQLFPEKINCCCNCPYCVAKRGGLKSYCHVHHHKHKIKVINGLVIKDGCCCKGFAVINDKDHYVITEFPSVKRTNFYILINYYYNLLLRPPFPSQQLKPPWI